MSLPIVMPSPLVMPFPAPHTHARPSTCHGEAANGVARAPQPRPTTANAGAKLYLRPKRVMSHPLTGANATSKKYAMLTARPHSSAPPPRSLIFSTIRKSFVCRSQHKAKHASPAVARSVQFLAAHTIMLPTDDCLPSPPTPEPRAKSGIGAVAGANTGHNANGSKKRPQASWQAKTPYIVKRAVIKLPISGPTMLPRRCTPPTQDNAFARKLVGALANKSTRLICHALWPMPLSTRETKNNAKQLERSDITPTTPHATKQTAAATPSKCGPTRSATMFWGRSKTTGARDMHAVAMPAVAASRPKWCITYAGSTGVIRPLTPYAGNCGRNTGNASLQNSPLTSPEFFCAGRVANSASFCGASSR
mmetsp:Transcript_23426/g.70367  ORF Transcript_23426/g.70367 Transcript_23426/m.70367 type:complete len:364 (-) Transcript_23426:231-1322(-)